MVLGMMGGVKLMEWPFGIGSGLLYASACVDDNRKMAVVALTELVRSRAS